MTTLIKEKINNELKDAMRARNQQKIDALRLINSAIKQIEVDERVVVDDMRLLVILDKMAKQRKESIAQFSLAKRQDLVDKEQFELDLINEYLPKPLTEAEVLLHVDEAFKAVDAKQMSDMSKVMAYLKPILQGRADLAKVSSIIKNKLTSA